MKQNRKLSIITAKKVLRKIRKNRYLELVSSLITQQVRIYIFRNQERNRRRYQHRRHLNDHIIVRPVELPAWQAGEEGRAIEQDDNHRVADKRKQDGPSRQPQSELLVQQVHD